ncbi:hypothetical protein LUZ60_010761 [Juncus effusus]|nr:hypothetical protein LUZ60_010761 [Juncus effusus]
MSDEFAGGDGGGSAGRTELIQPGRDLQSNWEVDLARKLEEYLLKICSGEMTSSEQDQALHSVNFAEAALLLQGSVQVYSRKVEYLYSLVIHALEFLSQKRNQQDQQDQQETENPDQPNRKKSDRLVNEEEEEFLGLEDVPEDPKADLDILKEKESWKKAVKPPANLIVIEGDCLDTSGADEIESYLLATCEFYKDFLLLDPCDAESINSFLQEKENEKQKQKENSIRSKNPKSTSKSAYSIHKENLENQTNLDQNENLEGGFEPQERENDMDFNNDDGFCENNFDMSPHNEPNFNNFDNISENSDGEFSDPWKPLNPHEIGSLKVKPFKKVKNYPRPLNFATKRCSFASQFPIVKFERTVNLQTGPHTFSESVIEIMRSLTLQDDENNNNNMENFPSFGSNNNENNFDENEGQDYDFGGDDNADDIFNNMDADLPTYPKNEGENDEMIGTSGTKDDEFDLNENLEDLCKKHLDDLLASVMETEKQSEIASRVSTWTDRIEHALEEQDTHGPFDIGVYGENILEKISSEAENTNIMSFTDVMSGKPKHEVARSFSALLQLANSGKVDLEKPNYGEELVCYTNENPFYVRLLGQDTNITDCENNVNNINDNIVNVSFETRKRIKSPLKKKASKKIAESSSSVLDGKAKVKLGKGKLVKSTPDGKKRRKAKLLGNIEECNSEI